MINDLSLGNLPMDGGILPVNRLDDTLRCSSITDRLFMSSRSCPAKALLENI
uniref:Uncharacterized protein n=1 Tax=Oryza brachyantha TaxID=4533 RepID=J3LAZ6_ORYBR